jgi:CheY-like chemotaxis protein
VPPDKTDAIFEAFQQVDGAINRTYEGTGLGLAIAKTLVELMDGHIWVGPHAGPGLTIAFTAFCPRTTADRVPDAGGEALRQQNNAARIPQGTRILVAEDNPENVILLQAYLDGLPVELDFAANGAEAVEKRCGRGIYDLIFMDIQMPVMDGYEATRQIRAWENRTGRPRVPVVALTAHALLHASAECHDAGCDSYLSKPVSREDLTETIVKYGGRKDSDRKVRWEEYIASRRPEFLANRRQDLERLLSAIASGDYPSIETIGHDCKGMSNGFGFPEIGSAGAALETAARTRDRVALQSAFEKFNLVVNEANARTATVG